MSLKNVKGVLGYGLHCLFGRQPLLRERAHTTEELDLGHGMMRRDRERVLAWYRLNLGDGMNRRRGVHVRLVSTAKWRMSFDATVQRRRLDRLR